jgi:hypothetical protein
MELEYTQGMKGGYSMTARHYRVPVDFTEQEREVLSLLCGKDFRTPEDQVRFLVVSEAERRGLARNEGNGRRLDNEPVTLATNA